MSTAPIAKPEPWTLQALCAQISGDAWYPEKGDNSLDALRICNGPSPDAACPVKADCLAYALRNRERHGIWGGLTTSARVKLERRPNGATRECVICRADYVGVQGQIYCCRDCHLEARRRRARSAS